MAQITQTMENKMDTMLEKMKKMDIIENHLLLIQQDISGIKTDMKCLDTRMSDIENAVAYMETDFTDIGDTVKKEKQRVTKLEVEMTRLKEQLKASNTSQEQSRQVEYLKDQNEALSRQMTEIDSYGRRSNLIFEGIEEARAENPWRKVQEVLNRKLGMNTREMKIERCHRLQGSKSAPKPIIVRFNWFADRQAVWENRRFLKGTPIYIREDYPMEVQKTRRSLSHTLTLAKTADKRATMVKDKLIFKGAAYDADKIPSEVLMLGEAGPGAKVVNGCVCFSGRASPFSNFYKSPFRVEGKLFKTNEHYYQYHKAKYAEDEMTAADILAEGDPAKVKGLGDKVKVKEEWYGNTALNVMTSGLVHKFQQNKHLMELIKKCASLKFAECSVYDRYWGNGLKWIDNDVGDSKKWKGKNMLGVCLQEAVKHFRRSYSQAAKP